MARRILRLTNAALERLRVKAMSSTSSAISFWSRNVIAYGCCFGLLIVPGGHQVIPFDAADDIYTDRVWGL